MSEHMTAEERAQQVVKDMWATKRTAIDKEEIAAFIAAAILAAEDAALERAALYLEPTHPDLAHELRTQLKSPHSK